MDNSATPSNDNTATTIPSDTTTPSDEPEADESYLSKSLVLAIDNSDVDVYWMNNDLVKELNKLAKDGLNLFLLEHMKSSILLMS